MAFSRSLSWLAGSRSTAMFRAVSMTPLTSGLASSAWRRRSASSTTGSVLPTRRWAASRRASGLGLASAVTDFRSRICWRSRLLMITGRAARASALPTSSSLIGSRRAQPCSLCSPSTMRSPARSCSSSRSSRACSSASPRSWPERAMVSMASDLTSKSRLLNFANDVRSASSLETPGATDSDGRSSPSGEAIVVCPASSAGAALVCATAVPLAPSSIKISSRTLGMVVPRFGPGLRGDKGGPAHRPAGRASPAAAYLAVWPPQVLVLVL